MRAVTIVDGSIEIREHPDPRPGRHDLLVRVRAAGVNAADLVQQAGFYPAPPGSPADIPGLELAGEVLEVGDAVRGFTAGDRVMTITGGGGQAELAVVHERTAMRVPARLTWEEAGAFPEVFTTAHDALFSQCELGSGERVCVHGAAGGVGSASVQLAAAVGASAVATVRNAGLREAVRALGAEEVVDPADFVARGPFDVIVDPIGAANWPGNLQALATGGRIAVLGVGSGGGAELDLMALMLRRGRIHGSTLRARPIDQKADACQRVARHVVPLLERGLLTVPVQEAFPFEQAAAAYRRFAEGGKLGKLVLTC